jgi:AcrR family transcriptional regulator
VPSELRVAPRQKRGRQRVDAILDAAAALLDERDLAAVSTTDVARRAGTSVGGLYRYFPEIDSLLRALAARNRQRYWSAALASAADATGRAFLEHLMAAYVRFARSEPGFRQLHFGHVLEDRRGEHSASASVTDDMIAALAERGGLVVTPELRLDVDIAVTMSAALMQRAFELDPEGDQRIIDRTIAMVSRLFAPHLQPSR